MRKRHIALFITPHFPHVHPTLPIVSTMVRRGFRSTYVTSDVFQSKLQRLGAEIVPRPRLQFNEGPEEGLDGAFCRLALRTLEPASAFYKENKPDLIVYDLADLAGRILAYRLNIPAVQISPHFAFDRDTLPQQIRGDEIRAIAIDVSRRADGFLAQHGVPSEEFLFHREQLNIYPFPRVLQPHGVRTDARLLYAGRCPGEQPLYGEWNVHNAKGRRVVLIAASTTHTRDTGYYPLCIEALSPLNVHTIFSVGANAHAIPVPDLPEHFEIVRDVSHGTILPYTDVLIYQGGTTTTAEAAYHGVPVLAVTYGNLELEWLADNIAEVGLGLHLRKSAMTSESLRSSASRLLDDAGIHRRVQQIKHAVRREPGAEEIVNAIEELL